MVTGINDLDLLKEKKHKLDKTLSVRLEWVATQFSVVAASALVWEERAIFLLSFTRNNVASARRGFFSSWCLGWAALFYCGIHWAFHIIILEPDNVMTWHCHQNGPILELFILIFMNTYENK